MSRLPTLRLIHSESCYEEPFYLGNFHGKHIAALVSKEPGGESSPFQVASEQILLYLMRKDQAMGELLCADVISVRRSLYQSVQGNPGKFR